MDSQALLQSVINEIDNLTSRVRNCNINHDIVDSLLWSAHRPGEGFFESPDESRSHEPKIPSLMEDNEAKHPTFDHPVPDEVIDSNEESLIQLETSNLTWINGLGPSILAFHAQPSPVALIACPNLAIEPKDYQVIALHKIELKHNNHVPGGSILLADPPGLGKTFPAIMAISKAVHAGATRFSIVVVPASCAEQWFNEFTKFLTPGAIKVLILRDSSVKPTELLKYSVIIVSYSFIMSQYRKLLLFVSAIDDMKQGTRPLSEPLKRPNLTIFSDIFFNREETLSPYLVLDEVNAIKNTNGLTFKATTELRKMAKTCLMLSGSPVDNTWLDLFSNLSMVEGHGIRTRTQFQHMFGSKSEDHTGAVKILPPRGSRFLRLIQCLNSFIVRRPESIITLPPITHDIKNFELNQEEAIQSNSAFTEYMSSASGEAQANSAPWRSFRRGTVAQATGGERQGSAHFAHLIKAVQHACHPMMVDIMAFARTTVSQDEEADLLFDEADIEQWQTWRERLKANDRWKSSRIIALIDAFNRCRDIDPECSVVIFDESVYFLDIVQAALGSMHEPVSSLRFDGRQSPEKRAMVLAEFESGVDATALLVSRAAGGVGLNIVSANIVILCNPWWKREWEKQAIKRVHRQGQVRPVTVISLLAVNSLVDLEKAAKRDHKHKHNQKIVDAITRRDDEDVVVRSNIA